MGILALNNVLATAINPILIGVIAAIVVLIVIVLIVIGVNANKKKKAAILAEYRRKEEENAAKQAQIEKEKAERRAAAQKKLQEEEDAAKAVEDEEAAKAKAKKAAEAKAKREAKKAAEAAAKKEAEEQAAAEAAAKVAAEEEARKAAEAEAKKQAAAEKRKEAAEEKARKAAEEKAAAEAAAKEQPAEVVEAPAEEKPVEKKAPAKKAAEKPATKGSRYSGKWIVYKVVTEGMDEDDMYFFELHASNGEKLLSSEEYTSEQGAIRGIETHKANIEKGNFRVGLSKKGDYIFKLLNGKGTLLCTGANYPTKVRCESAVESVKRFGATAVLDEKVQEIVLKASQEDDFTEPVEQVDEDYVGKWIISVNKAEDSDEKAYYFELFANNGEKLLSSEEYSSYIGAINGIETHKANIQKGNFRISLTKRGDYIFKLLSGNGQLLCLGEHYKSKARCESAVESVKRFALNAPVLTESDEVKA